MQNEEEIKRALKDMEREKTPGESRIRPLKMQGNGGTKSSEIFLPNALKLADLQKHRKISEIIFIPKKGILRSI